MNNKIPVMGGPNDGEFWPDGDTLEKRGRYIRDSWSDIDKIDNVLPHWSFEDYILSCDREDVESRMESVEKSPKDIIGCNCAAPRCTWAGSFFCLGV